MLRYAGKLAAFALAGSCLLASAAQPGLSESTCDSTVLGSLVVEEEGLRVATPNVTSLHAGDVLLQLNSHRLRGCGDLDRALDEARREGLTLVLLLRRGGERQAEWIESRPEQVAAEPSAASPPPPEAPPTKATAAPLVAAVPLATAAAVDTDAVRAELSGLLTLGRELRAALPVTSAEAWIRRIDEATRTHAAQPSPEGLDRVLSYYATIAEILAYREEATRDLGPGRHRAGLVLEYGGGSPVLDWFERYPFLKESVLRPYDRQRMLMTGRRMGRWSPDEAVRLLVDRALSEGEALDAELAASPSPP